MVRAAVDLAAIVKVFGSGDLVDHIGEETNSLINTLAFNHGVKVEETTRVVPILSVGNGVHIGAGQVSGPAEQVARVQAVAQLEGEFFAGVVRANELVPIDSLDPTKGLRRVQGVGVSAILDFRL